MTFEVVAEELTAHASHLDGLTDRMDTAISAAEAVSMSDEAYGLLCSFLPPIINPMEQEGMDALKAAKEGISVTADNVRQTSKAYQETDEAGADNFSQFDEAVRVKESAVALREPVGETTGFSRASSPVEPTAAYRPMERGEPAYTPAERGEPASYRQAERGEPASYTASYTPAEQGEPASYRQAEQVEPFATYRRSFESG
ncbi:type VII secretion target [Saccharopolyspora hattusasensis]|uniref:type VII secretion target n=1 Tax=Saccharopolyspora hattusasensis TaxID=1128679 RepID=UPI003D96A361